LKETLNLLPVEVRVSAEKKGRFYYLFLALAVYIMLMTSLWILKTVENKRSDSEINKLNKQKVKLQGKILPPPPPAPSPSVDKEILGAMQQTPKWSQIISELSALVPQDIYLSSIESKDDKGIRQMSIKGFSTTQLGVANLISALEVSRYFYGVEIVFSQKGEKDVSFELKAKLRWT
jgi:hypothetical protein